MKEKIKKAVEDANTKILKKIASEIAKKDFSKAKVRKSRIHMPHAITVYQLEIYDEGRYFVVNLYENGQYSAYTTPIRDLRPLTLNMTSV